MPTKLAYLYIHACLGKEKFCIKTFSSDAFRKSKKILA